MSEIKYTEEEIEYYNYLEDLRCSGVTNMFGAASYLQEWFELDKAEATNILSKWMSNYSEIREVLGW